MESSIRNLRQIRTYLSHQDGRHVFVSTVKYEGLKPDNNYTELAETMAFDVVDGKRGDSILQETDDSIGLYAMHGSVVSRFVAQGFSRGKTELKIYPGDDAVHDFSLELARRLFGVETLIELGPIQRQKLNRLLDAAIEEGHVLKPVVYGLNR